MPQGDSDGSKKTQGGGASHRKVVILASDKKPLDPPDSPLPRKEGRDIAEPPRYAQKPKKDSVRPIGGRPTDFDLPPRDPPRRIDPPKPERPTPVPPPAPIARSAPPPPVVPRPTPPPKAVVVQKAVVVSPPIVDDMHRKHRAAILERYGNLHSEILVDLSGGFGGPWSGKLSVKKVVAEVIPAADDHHLVALLEMLPALEEADQWLREQQREWARRSAEAKR